MSGISDNIIEHIRTVLQNYDSVHYNIPFLRSAAILILIMKKNKAFYFVMTARSKNLTKHNGEMSFPGGKFDPDQDQNLLDTALRETHEEIGIKTNNIDILGEINDLPTFTGYNIHPYIAYIDGDARTIQFQKNDSEVDEIVLIPLQFVKNLPKFTENTFKPPSSKTYRFLSFSFQESKNSKQHYIWGASAHIIADFMKIIFKSTKCSEKYNRPSILEIFQSRNLMKKLKLEKLKRQS
ncbi:MAG: NUDIX hydrolase [Promethearchaeota archaeon]